MLNFNSYLEEAKKCTDEATDTVTKDESGKVKSWSHEGDWQKKSGNKQGTGKAANLAGQALKKTKELAKEEVEEIEEDTTTPAQKLRAALDRHTEKAVAANKAGDDEAVKVHQGYMNKIKTKMGKLAKNEEIDLTEMEELCEISKDTLKSYVKGAAQDLPRLGNTLGRLQTHGKLKGVEDKLAKSIHNRYNGINKATEKLTKEELEEFMQTEAYEQLSELDKKTLSSYVKKSHDQLMKHTSSVATKYARGDKDAMAYALDKTAVRKTANRTKGVDTALDKLSKEELHPNQVKLDKNKNGKLDSDDFKKLRKEDVDFDSYDQISYTEMLNRISEGKIDDLKDKIAADREKRLNSYDFSKEKDKKSSVTKVKGHSYGAGEDEGEDEDDNNKKLSKPAAPVIKRGRGRPAGSKSGARN